MTFKPMLAATCKDLDKLKYPVLASIKLDGVRATVQGGQLLSRITAEDRANIYFARNSKIGCVGRLAKYKYFATGSKDKPRFPVFLGWRDKRDL